VAASLRGAGGGLPEGGIQLLGGFSLDALDSGIVAIEKEGDGRKMDPEKEIAHEMLRSIRQIVRRISEYSRQMLRESGLTVPQLVCLKAIGELEEERDEVSLVMVGRRVHLSSPTVSRIVDRLVQKGLVARERRSKDRRKVCLSLTPRGRERYRTLPTALQEQFVDRLMSLQESDRLALLVALQRIAELMDATGLDAAPILTPGEQVAGNREPEG